MVRGDSPFFGIPDSFFFNGLLFFLKGKKIGARLLSGYVSLKNTLLGVMDIFQARKLTIAPNRHFSGCFFSRTSSSCLIRIFLCNTY